MGGRWERERKKEGKKEIVIEQQRKGDTQSQTYSHTKTKTKEKGDRHPQTSAYQTNRVLTVTHRQMQRKNTIDKKKKIDGQTERLTVR